MDNMGKGNLPSASSKEPPNDTETVTEIPHNRSLPMLSAEVGHPSRACIEKMDDQSAKTATAMDWEGPNDPENPMNWSFAWRVYHTSVPALLCFIVTLGSSIYTPGVKDVEVQFDVSSTVALLGLSLYVLGLGFGPVLAAPLSETLGRRAVYVVSLPLTALFTLGAGFSSNFASLIVCRFFAGFFGSPTLAVGAGTNADLWPPVHRATATVLFLLSPFAGPTVGPIVGGFAAENKGWRWTQWPILFISAAAIIYCVPMKETYKKRILRQRAKKLGVSSPTTAGLSGFAAIKFLLGVTLFRPIHMIFTESIVGFLSLYIGFNFSVLFGFFDAFPIVFQGVYGFDTGKAGLPWLAVLVGCLLSTITVIVVDRFTFRKEYQKSLKEGRGGLVAPEHRLYVAMIGSLGLPVGLFWFGWTSRSAVHWISPVLAAIPFAWGNLCVFVSHSFASCFSPLRFIVVAKIQCNIDVCRFVFNRHVRGIKWCIRAGCKWSCPLYLWRRISALYNSK